MNKWLWGGLGWAIGGPIGAIMGYALGSMSSQNQNYSKTRGGDFGASEKRARQKRRERKYSTIKVSFILWLERPGKAGKCSLGP